MCNGANLAYERKAFNEVNGFAGVDHIASGDDMLLMHKIGKQYPERSTLPEIKRCGCFHSSCKNMGSLF